LSNIILSILYNKSSDNKLFLPLLIELELEGPTKVESYIDFDLLLIYNTIIFKPLWMKETIISLKFSSYTIGTG